jgi:hypothetical protein
MVKTTDVIFHPLLQGLIFKGSGSNVRITNVLEEQQTTMSMDRSENLRSHVICQFGRQAKWEGYHKKSFRQNLLMPSI